MIKIYAKYGQTFRKIRKQKNLKLTSFSPSGISSASICKFETGKSMLRFDTLTSALSELSFTLSDYENCLNNYTPDNHEILLNDLTIAILNGETHLSEFYMKACNLNESILALTIKGKYTKLSYSEIEEIIDYFEHLTFWREIDLYSLYLSFDHLKPSIISYLLETFFITNSMIFNSKKHRVKLAIAISKGILIFISENKKELSKHFLNYLNHPDYKHTMFTKNLYYFVNGCWNYKFIASNNGTEQIKRSIELFEYLGSPTISNYYRMVYKKYIEGS